MQKNLRPILVPPVPKGCMILGPLRLRLGFEALRYRPAWSGASVCHGERRMTSAAAAAIFFFFFFFARGGRTAVLLQIAAGAWLPPFRASLAKGSDDSVPQRRHDV